MIYPGFQARRQSSQTVGETGKHGKSIPRLQKNPPLGSPPSRFLYLASAARALVVERTLLLLAQIHKPINKGGIFIGRRPIVRIAFFCSFGKGLTEFVFFRAA